jgi:hypothetical protein
MPCRTVGGRCEEIVKKKKVKKQNNKEIFIKNTIFIQYDSDKNSSDSTSEQSSSSIQNS